MHGCVLSSNERDGYVISLHVEETNCSPEVYFDEKDNKLSIKGPTYPEDAYCFFKPINEWLDDYLLQMTSEAELNVYLSIPYMNTGSSKSIYKILEKLQGSYENGKKVKICWYYNKDNEDELENIEDIMYNLRIPIQTIGLSEK